MQRTLCSLVGEKVKSDETVWWAYETCKSMCKLRVLVSTYLLCPPSAQLARPSGMWPLVEQTSLATTQATGATGGNSQCVSLHCWTTNFSLIFCTGGGTTQVWFSAPIIRDNISVVFLDWWRNHFSGSKTHDGVVFATNEGTNFNFPY